MSSQDGSGTSRQRMNYRNPDGDNGKASKSSKSAPNVSRKQQLMQEMDDLINAMPVFVAEQPGLCKPRAENPIVLTSPHITRVHEAEQNETMAERTTEDKSRKTDEKAEIEARHFDDLTWEVDCNDKVWKFLLNKKIPHELKVNAIKKIEMLGKGDWSHRSLNKPLEGQAKQNDIKLYEAKLTKGGRILWELAIGFSPRCSGNHNEIGEGSSGNTEAEGQVYSEIIRVWDIVLDHSKVTHAIEDIVKSVKKGRGCLDPKKLKKINTESSTTQRSPSYFRKATGSTQEDAEQLFCPPASSKEDEYHILKFYSFSSMIVDAVVNNINVEVDFPFRVTDLEHAIINLQPKPPSSILLLGRSGTGKTTCCLYRMWNKFVRYWHQASLGGPMYPREVASIYQNKKDSKEPFQDSSRSRSGVSTAVDCTAVVNVGNNDDANNISTVILDHLHQIFITKNPALCREIKRNFCSMVNACVFAAEPGALQGTPLPNRFQDAQPARFPLFLSSRKFLLILDASLPNPYFPREPDGSLKRNISGWDEEDGPLTSIPPMFDEDDVRQDKDNATGGATNDPRQEVTYEVFAQQLWKSVNKKKLRGYDSTLVWMEIKSFIKGSVEALNTDKGHLSLGSYMEVGRKRASNFSADRKEIYHMFENYEHVKKQKNFFDEGDLVFHLYRRLQEKKLDWSIHEVYVDETQDFTQAELSLLIRCSDNPNALFLTGDTAQSIMRGVAFRFEDLKSLFHYSAKKSVKGSEPKKGNKLAVAVPKKVYQLIHNYRSHKGILNLASSIVDIMTHFFPLSFDHLERDKAMFPGPSPVLLEVCCFDDLIATDDPTLCRRKTSGIQFGAHQVILVANKESQKKLQSELRSAIVMTVFEAKGLEFNDVLLYNFFKDSLADKDWRVITAYLNEQKIPEMKPAEALQEIDIDRLGGNRPRPLKFNFDEHKVLNSELKKLYTAITRARVNLWIFDEDLTKRAPMFDYFCRLGLVTHKTKGGLLSRGSPSSETPSTGTPSTSKQEGQPSSECKGLVSSTSSADASTSTPATSKEDVEDAVFVKQSTKSEWAEQGDYYFQNSRWEVAAKCYMLAGDERKMLLAQAHRRATEAGSMSESPHKMQREFLESASLYLKCGEDKIAVNCLYNAREYGLLAKLLEKQGKFSRAAKIYDKRLNRVSDACRCLELMGDYARAIDLLCSIGSHSEALEVVDRFKRLKQELTKKEDALPCHITPPGSTHSTVEIIYRCAEYHYKQKHTDQMLDALKRLDNFEEIIDFLCKRKLFTEAVSLLKEKGQILEAAKILRKEGKLEEASTLMEYSDNPEFVAECRLSGAKQLLVKSNNTNNLSTAIKHLTEAEDLFSRCSDSLKKAETQLLLGHLQKDVAKIRRANRYFSRESHIAGESECIDNILELSSPSVRNRVFHHKLENLIRLICALFECKTADEERQRLLCQEFFGLVPGWKADQLHIQSHEGARITSVLGKKIKTLTEDINAERVRHNMAESCLIPRALRWMRLMRKELHADRQKLAQCRDYVIGKPCTRKPPETCPHLHEPYSSNDMVELVKCHIELIEINNIINKASLLVGYKSANELTKEIQQCKKEQSETCKSLYYVFFPEHCHHVDRVLLKEILELVQVPVIKRQMKIFVEDAKRKAYSLHHSADTNVYLLCHGINQLTGERSKAVEDWVTQEEEACLTWQQKEGWRHPHPHGMCPLYPHKPRKGYKSYKRYHLASINSLYVKCDGNQSLLSFKDFMETAGSAGDMLLPSISNTVAMIEARVTLVLAIGAKCRHCVVAIPSSYLEQAAFFDAIHCQGHQGNTFYTAVKHMSSPDERTSECVHFLVDLICGIGKTGSNFNVLARAFASEDCINTGLAERTFILVLVMLCNAGMALPDQIINDILTALKSISQSSHLPKRVLSALIKIQSAHSRTFALRTLHKLLAAHEDEKLRVCGWNPDMPPFEALGLDDRKHNLKSIPNQHFSEFPPVSSTIIRDQEPTDQEDDEHAHAVHEPEESAHPATGAVVTYNDRPASRREATVKKESTHRATGAVVTYNDRPASRREATGLIQRRHVERVGTYCDEYKIKRFMIMGEAVEVLEDAHGLQQLLFLIGRIFGNDPQLNKWINHLNTLCQAICKQTAMVKNNPTSLRVRQLEVLRRCVRKEINDLHYGLFKKYTMAVIIICLICLAVKGITVVLFYTSVNYVLGGLWSINLTVLFAIYVFIL